MVKVGVEHDDGKGHGRGRILVHEDCGVLGVEVCSKGGEDPLNFLRFPVQPYNLQEVS